MVKEAVVDRVLRIDTGCTSQATGTPPVSPRQGRRRVPCEREWVYSMCSPLAKLSSSDGACCGASSSPAGRPESELRRTQLDTTRMRLPAARGLHVRVRKEVERARNDFLSSEGLRPSACFSTADSVRERARYLSARREAGRATGRAVQGLSRS